MKAPAILKNLPEMLAVLRRETKKWKQPIVGTFSQGAHAPFKVLISTVLSLRTKDQTTEAASHRLFALADTPQNMLTLSISQIEKAIYPWVFTTPKAKNILKICEELLLRFGGQVPDE